MKSLISAPLIGPWLYRRSVRDLKDRALKGDEGAVRELTGILCTSRDQAVRDIARTTLCSLISPPAIDIFCKEALERDNAALYHIATDNNFQPSDPGTLALFLFVTGQRERYAECDPLPNRPLLAAGYAQATNRVRIHTLHAAHKNGRGPILAAALMETAQKQNATPWSEDEWKIVVTSLVQGQQWEVLWRLVAHAPLPQAIAALSAMETSGWKPEGDERAIWEDIIHTMPREWTSPVPQDATPSPSWSPDSQPMHIAFSEDGTLLATGCANGTIYLWNTRTGTLVFRLPSKKGTTGKVIISPGNACLLCAGTDGTLQCHDTLTGALLWSLTFGEHAPLPFACSREGRAIIPLSTGGNLRIVNLADGQVQEISGGHKGAVTCCVLSCDDRLCAVGYDDGAVGIWDIQRSHYSKTLEGLGDPVSSLTFSGDLDECLVVYTRNQPVRWLIAPGMRTRTYTGHTGPLHGYAISPDGDSFAIAGDDRILRFWQAGNTAPIAEHPLYNRSLTACTISSDSSRFAAGCTDGTLRLYAVNGGTLIHEKKAHKQAVTAIALSSSAGMVASAGGDGTVKLWDIISGELHRTLMKPAGSVTGIAATPDGSTIYTGYTDGTARQIQRETGEFNRTFDMYTSTVRAIAITPDGTLLACAGGDTTLRCWNCETGGLVTGIEGLTTTQRCLVFSPDGKILVSGGWDGKVRLWSMPDGCLIKTLAGHTSTITALTITPDGSRLATGSNDQSVRLWDLDEDTCISIREDLRSEVSALAYSPERELLAFAGTDAIIHLCHLKDGTHAGTIPSLPGKVTALAFAGDSRVLVAGFDTGTVAIFSCAGRHLLKSIPAHNDAVTGIVVLPGGESVLTSSLDGQVRHWNLPWTRPLSGTTLDTIPLAALYERTARTDMQAQWVFLHRMLTLRFRNDIELCTMIHDTGMYDIQIVG